MGIILTILLAYGLSSLIINASILTKPRMWVTNKYPLLGELLSCYQCLGFWVGLILAIIGLNMFPLLPYIGYISTACVISGTNEILGIITGYLYRG